MPASAFRMTKRREGKRLTLPMAASTTVYGGTMVAVLANGTGAVPAGTASSGRAVGVACDTVANGAVAGVESVTLEQGTFHFANSSAGDEIGIEHIGEACYVVDDQTVALTDDSGSRVIAGAIADVDAQGVWVRIEPGAVGPQGEQGEPG
jgi:hypothetical protein